MQVAKDAEAKWYKLLSLMLVKDMKMVPATGKKGFFTFIDGDKTAFIALATDDILLGTSFSGFYDNMKNTFDTYFAYTGSPIYVHDLFTLTICSPYITLN